MNKRSENLVSVQVSPETMEAVLQKIKEIREVLNPLLISLKAEERRGGLKMRDKSLPFVEKVVEYAQSHPKFVPPFLNVEEFLIDIKAVGDLTQIVREIKQLNDSLDDTIMLSGSEAYAAALTYYNSVKQAAKMNVPDAKGIVADLKQRFER